MIVAVDTMNQFGMNDLLYSIHRYDENEEEQSDELNSENGQPHQDDEFVESNEEEELFSREQESLIHGHRRKKSQKRKTANDQMNRFKTTVYPIVFLTVAVACAFGLLSYLHGKNKLYSASKSESQSSNTNERKTLLINIIPASYILYFDVDMIGGAYKGVSTIVFTCKDNHTKEIVLNSAKTRIQHVNLQEKEGNDGGKYDLKKKNELKIIGIKYDLPVGQMKIELNSFLKQNGKYILEISFDKNLTYANDEGFYLTKYRDGKNQEKISASTQFEMNFARKIFPCFDEPTFKATFQIIIQHDKDGCKAISSMPVEKQVDVGTSRVETHFQTTPRLSTSAIGWFLADMDYKEVMLNKSVPVRLYAPKDRMNETCIAVKMAPLCFKYYEKEIIFNKLTKLDIIPVKASALISKKKATWGMILMAEDDLLHSGAEVSLPANQSPICRAIAEQMSLVQALDSH